MTINLATYFDSAYLPQGIALLRSLMRHVPGWRLWVLALDTWTADVISEIAASGVYGDRLTVIPLESLLRTRPGLGAIAEQRGWRDFIFSLTPAWAEYVLTRAGPVAYIDADCYFFSDPAPLYAEVAGAPIAIIPHRWTPAHAARLRPNGMYNVGWVYFTHTPRALECLGEWHWRCLDWRPAGALARFSDQVFLDDWPERYGAHVVAHPGANLAPWSAEQYDYLIATYREREYLLLADPGRTVTREGIMEPDWQPILFYHFHEFRSKAPGMIYRTGYPIPAPVARLIYPEYEREVADVTARLYA